MLSQSATYALRAVVVLGSLEASTYMGAAAIAKKIGAPQNYLSKILQQLGQVGVVQSRRGVDGGFRLSRPAKEISLFEVVDPIDRLESLERCLLRGGRCGSSNVCSVHERWRQVRDALISFLRSTRISDIPAEEVFAKGAQ